MEQQIGANTSKRRWILTINNETRTDDELQKYIQELEHFKYAMFQREKGHNTGTEHIQLFIIFSINKRFNTIKNYFPTAHIEPAKGTNAQCRDYCSKNDTRVSGPYELGQFAEERARTDISTFIELVKSGADEETLCNLYPTLYLKELNKIKTIYENSQYEKYKSVKRDVEVTYIYGPPGSGKTSYIVNNYGLGTFYNIPVYNNSAFDMYHGEDVIVFDEFDGQIPITQMNKYIDIWPVQLPARFSNKQACYTKVFIVSNLSIRQLYEMEQEKFPTKYKAFCRRIHNIIRIDYKGIHYEKGINSNINQVCLDDIVELSQDEKVNVDEVFSD